MAQTLVKQYTHIIFSTKNREKLILPSIENELYLYLGGTCNNLDCPSVKIGGHLDHVHILCVLSKKITFMDLLGQIKSYSSKWIKTKGEAFKDFYWQGGYGAFSVSPGHVAALIEYIENQHAHHANVSFKEEFIQILKKNNVEYDERYLWD